MLQLLPRTTHFPYTTLFRSRIHQPFGPTSSGLGGRAGSHTGVPAAGIGANFARAARGAGTCGAADSSLPRASKAIFMAVHRTGRYSFGAASVRDGAGRALRSRRQSLLPLIGTEIGRAHV